MEKIVRVWGAAIGDRGSAEGGESTAARNCSLPLAISSYETIFLLLLFVNLR